MLRGYHKNEQIPLWARPGRLVWFPKGTVLRSMHPSKDGSYKASRRQKVVVNHTLPGQSILLGSLYADGTFYPQQRLKDVAHHAAHRGLENPFRDADATFEFLRNHEDAEVRASRYSNAKVSEVWLHTASPSVRWPGAGGYWVEADINDCNPASLL